MIFPFLFLTGVQSGATITPATLIDESYIERGYGAISMSALPTPTLELRAGEPTIGREVRMKNRWRVHPHKTMPGVLIAEVAPYADLFDADGFALADARLGEGAKIASPPKPKTLADLAAPRGTLVRVKDLLALYKLSAEELPWIYRYRTVRVRIDPKRVKDPGPLVRALTGAKFVRDKKTEKETTEFDPGTFRPLAVATLAQSEMTASDEGSRVRFFLGRYGHERIADAELVTLYRFPNALETYRMPSFPVEHPQFLEQHVKREFGDDPASPNLARFLKLASLDSPIGVSLNTNGQGALALRNHDDDAWVVF